LLEFVFFSIQEKQGKDTTSEKLKNYLIEIQTISILFEKK